MTPIIGNPGDRIDPKRDAEIIAGEERRREECRAGTRPWKVRPGESALVPEGIAGMTPEEEARLARFQANCDILFTELRERGLVF